MAKFVLKNIESVKGKQQFKQLVIVDDKEDADTIQSTIKSNETNKTPVEIKGVFDEYESSLETKYKSSFNGVVAIMNRVANLLGVPETKFKDITPSGEAVKEYEIKFQDLRVFAISTFGGKIVVLGGYKNNQKAYINRFRSVKKQYLSFQKIKNDQGTTSKK